MATLKKYIILTVFTNPTPQDKGGRILLNDLTIPIETLEAAVESMLEIEDQNENNSVRQLAKAINEKILQYSVISPEDKKEIIQIALKREYLSGGNKNQPFDQEYNKWLNLYGDDEVRAFLLSSSRHKLYQKFDEQLADLLDNIADSIIND